MDIKKELSEIMSKVAETQVTEKEANEIVEIMAAKAAIVERMKHMDTLLCAAALEERQWWYKMYKKYRLEPGKQYSFNVPSRAIFKKEDENNV